MSPTNDAVVVGAGHQGLAAAVTLAQAGWSVLVLEAAPHPGGALQSGELTLPGYVHDLFATNLNLFLASRFYAEHAAGLERHGFAAARTKYPFASAFPDASALGVTTDLSDTLSGLAALEPRDATGWGELYALFGRVAPTLFRLYAARAPSMAMWRVLVSSALRLKLQGAGELARLLASSCRELLDAHLASDKAKALVAPWGLHLDLGPGRRRRGGLPVPRDLRRPGRRDVDRLRRRVSADRRDGDVAQRARRKVAHVGASHAGAHHRWPGDRGGAGER